MKFKKLIVGVAVLTVATLLLSGCFSMLGQHRESASKGKQSVVPGSAPSRSVVQGSAPSQSVIKSSENEPDSMSPQSIIQSPENATDSAPSQSVIRTQDATSTPASSGSTLQEVTIGDTIVSDQFEITIVSVEIAPEAYAHGETGMFESYFQAGEGNTFVDLTVSVKNLHQKNVNSGNVMRVEVNYNDGYTYSANDYVESKSLGLSSLGSYSGETIKPLETIEIRYIAECPLEVADNIDAPLFLQLSVKSVKYKLVIR